MEQGSRHKQAHLQMEESNCTESILKYTSPSNDNYFLSTARQSLPERLASLKAHVFSNSGNANSLPMPNSEQTNCFAGTQIYSSDASVAPPSQDNISQASRETCTDVDASSNLECSGSLAHLRQEQLFIEDRSDFTNTINAEFRSNNFDSNNSEHGSIDHQTFSHQPTSVNTQRYSTRNGTFVTNCHRKNNIILERKALPIVVVTPASEDICNFNSDNMDSKIENSNGDIDGMLNDCLDTCSLSSVCSEDDILTDDEPSESDSASQIEEKTDKGSNWKKIRRMIHWSPFVQNFKKRYPWVQLAGHQGCFRAGENGTILKKTTEKEKDCLIKLMKDILRPYVPEYKKEVEKCGEKYLEMQDLLQEFDSPCVMDCKMGVRTYLEEELAKARSKPRKDLYQKMVEVSPTEPTDTENKTKAITKPRYMQWREKLSSSATLGFRIEGIKKSDQKPNKDFKKTKTKDDVDKVFTEYIENDPQLRSKYLRRLKAIRATLEASGLFKSHEVIGSSLLFVHDLKGHASVWMIDFGKTVPLPEGAVVNHRSEWKEGNHEDGYLWGLDKMIEVWAQR